MSLLLPLLALAAARAASVAVVVGIEHYERLDAELPGAREDAARVADALQAAGFDEVRLLTDSSARRAGLDALLGELAGRLGPDDLLLLYLELLAVGEDFGDPRLLPADAEPGDLQASSLSVAELGSRLASLGAGRLVLLTDCSHQGSVEGLALLGPGPDDWPDLGGSSVVIAASGPLEPSRPGVFASSLVAGLSGEAERSGDGVLQAGELFRYLLDAVSSASGDAQHPVVDARYDPGLAVLELGAGRGIDKVKFVFRGGYSPRVECPGHEPVACEPVCTLWELEPGSCELSAVVGDRRLRASVELRERGRVVCEPGEDRLDCRFEP